MRAHDQAAVHRVLGPDADEVLSSGDDIIDQSRREKFVRAYDEKHDLTSDDRGDVTLLVGKDDWPLPIPIVPVKPGQWRFDIEAGKDEILSRRIGQNELDVIEVCQAFVDAQQEYATSDPNGDGVPEYAQKILSDPGKKNGLYWPTAEGERPSPLGPLVAEAVEEGYSSSASKGEPRPYHGYCYRLLKAQGPHAAGGALDYVIRGRMLGGFALMAYPAEYGKSGIMTFIVNHQGVVYQKDLGPDSAKIAKAMQTFDPGAGWEAVPAEAGAVATESARPD